MSTRSGAIVLFVVLAVALVNAGCSKKDEELQPGERPLHAEETATQETGNTPSNASGEAEDPFDRAKRLDTIEGYQEYLAANPRGKHRDAALDAIDALIKNDVLVYLGYLQGTCTIEQICSADLRGMCLSDRVTRDMGTRYLDLYCDEKVAILGEVGKGVRVLFIDDRVSIAYEGGTIMHMRNRDIEQYRKRTESVQLIKGAGLTFGTTLNGVKASRTYYSGAINL